MAKSTETAPLMPKTEPRASISWPAKDRTEGKKGVKVTGSMHAMGLGKRCRVTIEGTVRGFHQDEWSGGLELETKAIEVEYVREASTEDDESMTDMVDRMQGKEK